jgi:[protein-PII] uridylyltransferase
VQSDGRDDAAERSLRAERDAIVAAARSPADYVDLPQRYAAAADGYLERLVDHATQGDPSGVAIVAVGSYGRRELCPGSDLDLTLIHRGRRRDVEAVAQRIWYRIWDEGIRLDHSVRTPREALAAARDDLRVALGLLDARVVGGDPDVAAKLLPDSADQFRAHSRSFLAALGAAVDERHRASGEVPFELEPDLKEARGGLRDVTALRAAALALPDLAHSLRADELEGPASVLLAARVALHIRTGRSHDRLLLQEQDQIAAMLGYVDADRLMARVAAAGREIGWTCDSGWRRIRSWSSGPKGRSGGRDRPLGVGVVLRDGEIALTADPAAEADPSILARVAAIAAREGAAIAPAALDRLAGSGAGIPEPWPAEFLHDFLVVLGAGSQGVTVLEVLDQRRLLERLIPEWSAVRSLPQRNAYHRFTVDRHLLEAVARASDLVRQVARPDLLLIGALLHDIGKGQPGDHTQAGVQIAPQVARRMGFGEADVATLVLLIRHHLLLADVATRRDLDDPATIMLVADAVRDRPTLDLLAALTEADSLATGAAAWGTWKAQLVGELVARVSTHITGAGPDASVAFPSADHLALMADGALRLLTEATGGAITLTVVAPDRPGLLATCAGVITLHGMEVRRAAAAGGEPGMAVERFDVEPTFGRVPDWSRVEADLVAALEGKLLLEARLAQQSNAYSHARRPVAARPPETRVIVDNDASELATLIEVRAADRHGLLHEITRALAGLQLDVASARVNTLGHEVVDTFYVREAGRQAGRKIVSDLRLQQIREVLLSALAD